MGSEPRIDHAPEQQQSRALQLALRAEGNGGAVGRVALDRDGPTLALTAVHDVEGVQLEHGLGHPGPLAGVGLVEDVEVVVRRVVHRGRRDADVRHEIGAADGRHRPGWPKVRRPPYGASHRIEAVDVVLLRRDDQVAIGDEWLRIDLLMLQAGLPIADHLGQVRHEQLADGGGSDLCRSERGLVRVPAGAQRIAGHRRHISSRHRGDQNQKYW